MLLFPTDLASFIEIIRQNGDVVYSLMFTYASSHSLILALFGGYAAHSGALNFSGVIAACWAGSFFSDIIRFWIGRRFGGRLFKRFPRIERMVKLAAALSEKHSVWMILLHRYPHGIRGVAALAYGMSKLSWPKFLALNFVAAGLWALAVVSAGFAFGGLSEKVLSDASSSLGMVTLIFFLGLSWLLGKKFEAAAERELADQKAKAVALSPVRKRMRKWAKAG